MGGSKTNFGAAELLGKSGGIWIRNLKTPPAKYPECTKITPNHIRVDFDEGTT